jgi:hypothetical protein
MRPPRSCYPYCMISPIRGDLTGFRVQVPPRTRFRISFLKGLLWLHTHCRVMCSHSEIFISLQVSCAYRPRTLQVATHSSTLTFVGPKSPGELGLKCALPLPDVSHMLVCDTIVCMAQVDRFSVTMPPELGEGVRQAAARQGTSVSTWLTEAAADKLRNEFLGAALDQWEAEDGSFTQAELDEAASRLGLAPRSDVA